MGSAQEMNEKRILNVVAAALVKKEDGKLLLARRPAGKSLAGLWEYPGGKIEAGETPKEALARELEEELNITVLPSEMHQFEKTVFEYEAFILNMELFICFSWSGDPTPKEGQEISWTDVCFLGLERDKYPMPPADEVISDHLRNYLSH
ncbi:nUDIX hydrolase (NudG) putative dihydroneopterin triphosphate pyrophosphatase (NtpA-like) [Acetobacter sp. CAG:977]|nr:nUDIX hydrolase (NudG) putative dihydroneopterin triphosphate pyrophosphatase (NtpA-like) [Acetobacter sp. CAG:977]